MPTGVAYQGRFRVFGIWKEVEAARPTQLIRFFFQCVVPFEFSFLPSFGPQLSACLICFLPVISRRENRQSTIFPCRFHCNKVHNRRSRRLHSDGLDLWTWTSSRPSTSLRLSSNDELEYERAEIVKACEENAA